MNFWQIFIRVLWSRPLPALGALWWHLTRRRVRARNRLRAAGASLPFAYDAWIRNVEQPEQGDKRPLAAIKSRSSMPAFTVLVYGSDYSSDALLDSIRSVERQVYPRWSVMIIGAKDRLQAHETSRVRQVTSPADAFDQLQADFLIPLGAGNQLSDWALFYFAEALQAEGSSNIVYGDEDELDARGVRRRPWFKPDWNGELFLARDYLSRACAIRVAAARNASDETDFSGEAWVLDLLLRVLETNAGPITHVARIVAHVRDVHAQTSQQARVRVVSRHVQARGGSAIPGTYDSVKVCWPLPEQLPLVSVIIPTRDKLELLQPCLESVLDHTDYRPLELIVVDNASVEFKTLSYLHELRARANVRVLSYPQPYNYSAINNFAARQANGSFLCLLNNDTEVVDGDWLTEMMRYAVRPEIGAVGAKLLYADGSIQHAGVVVGIGDAAGHAHRNLPAGDAGYFAQAHLPQFVSAVTGACLLVEKCKFLMVKGLDEEDLPIAYNDVDICMKLTRSGLRNVYVPHARLIHYESKSRDKDHAPSRIHSYRRELEAFQERWGVKEYQDPLHNPNLDRTSETFVIRF